MEALSDLVKHGTYLEHLWSACDAVSRLYPPPSGNRLAGSECSYPSCTDYQCSVCCRLSHNLFYFRTRISLREAISSVIIWNNNELYGIPMNSLHFHTCQCCDSNREDFSFSYAIVGHRCVWILLHYEMY